MTEDLLKSIKGQEIKIGKCRKSKRKNKSRNPQDLAEMLRKTMAMKREDIAYDDEHGQMNKNRVNLIHVGSNTSNVKN